MSIRATTRLTGFSKTTVMKLAVDAGKAAAWYQDRVFNSLSCKSSRLTRFGDSSELRPRMPTPTKRPLARLATHGYGSRPTPIQSSSLAGMSERATAKRRWNLSTIAGRLANRVQITTDGHKAYLYAMDAAFGGEVDYAMLVKLYGPSPEGQRRYFPAECTGIIKTPVSGNPDMAHVSTSYAERNNLNIRMHSRRMTRLTNAFSKKMENHAHAMALHFFYYNFVRIHKTLKVTPAMAAGVTDRLWEVADMVGVLEAWEAI